MEKKIIKELTDFLNKSEAVANMVLALAESGQIQKGSALWLGAGSIIEKVGKINSSLNEG